MPIFDVLNGEDVFATYDDIERAKSLVAHHKQFSNIKMRIKKRLGDPNWRDRERARYEDGTYTPLPSWWVESDWWKANTVVQAHFPYFDADSDLIYYTENADKGSHDIKSHLTVTRYLGKYFSKTLKGNEIDRIYGRLIAGDLALKISFDPEMFEKVFENQNVKAEDSDYESCMRYSRDEWETEHHPAYVYGAGDLAIAWFEDTTDGDFVVLARAVVYPEKKTFIRIYGTHEKYCRALEARLLGEGYKRAENFNGAKLLKITLEDYIPEGETTSDDDFDCFLMPYVDGKNRIVEYNNYFKFSATSKKSLYCDTTDNLRLNKKKICYACGGESRMYSKLWLNETESSCYCDSCRDTGKYPQCYLSGEYVASDSLMQEFRFHDGRMHKGLSKYFKDHSIHFCDHTKVNTFCRKVLTKDGYKYFAENLITYYDIPSKHRAFYCERTDAYFACSDFEQTIINYSYVCVDPNKYGNFQPEKGLENVGF